MYLCAYFSPGLDKATFSTEESNIKNRELLF